MKSKIMLWLRIGIWIVLFTIPVFRYFQTNDINELAGSIVGLILLIIFRWPVLMILNVLFFIFIIGNYLDKKHLVALQALVGVFLVNIAYWVLFGINDIVDTQTITVKLEE